jgi:hypothetical protein
MGCVLVMLAAGRASGLAAQAVEDSRLRWNAGVHLIGLGTRVDPALSGEAMTEAYLTQPLLFARMQSRHVGVSATLNLEGLTLENGELAPGNSGEGFVDKRHPHTYLHEFTITASGELTGFGASLTAGRGFAPFGTDDPMVRPFVKYPANHHWSHVLERWVLIAGIRRGAVLAEAGMFSGNEPTGPDDLEGLDRFPDSWAGRVTLYPLSGLELQGSHARIESPELDFGGLDQRKWSGSARIEREVSTGVTLYALLEWAETHEYSGDVKAFIFTSALAETALTRDPWKIALRFERTTRPEEERLADQFRTPRPHTDESILGVTRWNTVTAHAARSFSLNSASIQPFAEISRSFVREITNSVIIDPVELYGADRLWSLSLGLRIRAGTVHQRMGRYGVAMPAAGPHALHESH